jgi:hypothetical protein
LKPSYRVKGKSIREEYKGRRVKGGVKGEPLVPLKIDFFP